MEALKLEKIFKNPNSKLITSSTEALLKIAANLHNEAAKKLQGATKEIPFNKAKELNSQLEKTKGAQALAMAEVIKLERKEAAAVLREKSNNKESLARKQQGNKLVSKLAEVTEIMAETSKELSNAQPKAKWYQPIVDFMQKFSKQNTPTTPSASTPQQPAKIAAKTANPKKDQINKESHYYTSKPDIERRNSYKGHSR